MEFNDTTNNSGLIQDLEDLLGFEYGQISDSTKRLQRATRYMNEGYSRVAYLILTNDGRWQWDDKNHTNQPVATADLVADQERYDFLESAPTALQDWLMLEQVEVLDSSDNATKLKRIDKRNVGAWTEFMDSSSIPEWFDLEGTAILLKPAPDYDKSAGLRFYFKRAPSYFSSSDTTKQPGFATIFHPYLSYYAAKKWSLTDNNIDVRNLEYEIQKMEADIVNFYSQRDKTVKNKLKRKNVSYK